MRAFLGHSGVCAGCQTFAHLWVDAPGTSEAERRGQQCDDCELARRKAEAREHERRHPGAGYPYPD